GIMLGKAGIVLQVGGVERGAEIRPLVGVAPEQHPVAAAFDQAVAAGALGGDATAIAIGDGAGGHGCRNLGNGDVDILTLAVAPAFQLGRDDAAIGGDAGGVARAVAATIERGAVGGAVV